MTISRRQVLGVTTAAAASVSLLGPTGAVGAAQVPRFHGDPGRGRVFYGAALPWPRSLPAWEDRLGRRLSVRRTYYDPRDARQLHERVREDRANRRLPHVSIKPAGSWASIAAGRHDRWLHQVLDPLRKQRIPVFFTLHHEPENDAGGPGMSPSDFVAMQRRVIRIARNSCPNVTVVPVLQHWTFDPRRSDAQPAQWVVPEAAVFGVDLYNPWSPTNGLAWRSFAAKAREVRRWARDTPMAVAEYGCRADPRNPGRAKRWMRDAFVHARDHNIVAMSYFNSDNSRHESWELHGARERVFARTLRRERVARIKRPG